MDINPSLPPDNRFGPPQVDLGDLKRSLDTILMLEPTELKKVLGIVSGRLMETNEPAGYDDTFSEELPNLHVPTFLLPNFVELLFVTFLQEVFSKVAFKKDFQARSIDDLTNDSSITIATPYASGNYKYGQVPSITVEYESVASSPDTINMQSPKTLGMDPDTGLAQDGLGSGMTSRSGAFRVPVTISVVTEAYQETTALGFVVFLALLQNKTTLPQYFDIKEMGMPQFYKAQVLAENEGTSNRYISRVTTYVDHIPEWVDILAVETYSNIIYRLVARMCENDKNTISHLIGLITEATDEDIAKLIAISMRGQVS